ncbi:MAG: cytidylate kinase-like family protein [Fibrobacter sp.]|nr:cytidylate kinase-like family protein [Fibrobacter sp.]
MDKDKKTVITISREPGSGGSFIGRALARELGISYVDREIVREAAKYFKLPENKIDSLDEKLRSFWDSFYVNINGYQDVYLPPQIVGPTDWELFEIESMIIRKIAEIRSAVIIGRCGFHVLKDCAHHIRVFLYADKDFRIDRIKKLRNLSYEEAKTMVLQSDKDRKNYYKTFTGKDWSDTGNYDIAINTTSIDLLAAVKMIMNFIYAFKE